MLVLISPDLAGCRRMQRILRNPSWAPKATETAMQCSPSKTIKTLGLIA
jgi:hypothetical protein